MKALLLAVLIALPLPSQATQPDTPATIEDLPLQEEIFNPQTGRIYVRSAKMYVCGTGTKGAKRNIRYVLNIESVFNPDGVWTIIEPEKTDSTWEEWDNTYRNFCGEKREEEND